MNAKVSRAEKFRVFKAQSQKKKNHFGELYFVTAIIKEWNLFHLAGHLHTENLVGRKKDQGASKTISYPVPQLSRLRSYGNLY